MGKKYFIVKTEADQSIAQLVEDGFFEEWCQTPKKSMEMGDVVFLYDMNLTGEAKDKKWLPFKCVAELTDVGKETMSLRLLYEIDYTKLKFDKDEKVIVAKMQQGSDGVYELKEQGIISKLEEQNSENIIKRVCKELGITQRELAERMEIPESTIARWKNGDIPRLADLYLNALLENVDLKTKLEAIKKAHKIMSSL